MKEKVVIYARYSSDKQTEQSIEGQLRECYEFAKRNEYVVIGEYIDRALTGTSDKRPEFLKMIEDSKKKIFNYVLVYQLDRFARNRYDSATYKAKLKKNGIRVLSARENISDDASGVLVEGMLESMAEYFSKELSQKVTRGMKETIMKGNWTGGKITYGYNIVDKKYVINKEQSNIVKEIFNRVLLGDTLKDIAIDLNNRGFKNQLGKKFITSFISRLVRNRKYIGEISNKYDFKGLIEPIIDKSTFDLVQERLSPHKQKSAQYRAPEFYYLSGKTYCAYCKQPVTADSGTSSTGNIYKYYKCSNRKKHKGSCNKRMISKEKLENIIIDKTIKDIFNEDLINEIAKNVTISFNKEVKEDLEVKSLENQLNEVNKKIENIMSAIEKGIVTNTTKDRLMENESKKADLLEDLAIAKNKALKPIDESDVKRYLYSYKKLDYAQKENRNKILQMFVRAVYLFDDYAFVAYNGTNDINELNLGNKKTERETKFEYGSIGTPKGNRTPDSTVRGWRLNRLTIRANLLDFN